MTWLILAVLLLLPVQSWGAIAFSRVGHNDAASVTTLQVTIQIDVGDTVIVTHTNSHGSDTTTAPTDTGGNTYTLCGAVSPNTTVAVWKSLRVANSATSVTVNASTTDNIAASVTTYTGVGSLGACSSNTASGTGTSGTLSMTPAGTTSWMVGGATNLGNVTSCTIVTGTFRDTCWYSAGPQASTFVSVITHTGASPLTTAWSWTTSGQWGVVGVELIPPADTPSAQSMGWLPAILK